MTILLADPQPIISVMLPAMTLLVTLVRWGSPPIVERRTVPEVVP